MFNLLFWIIVVTAVLLAVAVGVGVSRSEGQQWLRPLLLYLTAYCAWLVLTSSVLLQGLSLTPPAATLAETAALLRALVAVALLYAGPAFALRTAGVRIGRWEWWLLSLPVAFVVGTLLVYWVTGVSRVARVPNAFFTGYIGALFLFAALRSARRASPGRPLPQLRLLLWLSAAAYLLLLGLNILVFTLPPSPIILVLTIGGPVLYCLAIAVIALHLFATGLPIPPVPEQVPDGPGDSPAAGPIEATRPASGVGDAPPMQEAPNSAEPPGEG